MQGLQLTQGHATRALEMSAGIQRLPSRYKCAVQKSTYLVQRVVLAIRSLAGGFDYIRFGPILYHHFPVRVLF